MCTKQGLWEAPLGPGGAESALGWGWNGEAEKIDTELALKELTVSLGKDRKAHQETEGLEHVEKLRYKAGKPAQRRRHPSWVSDPDNHIGQVMPAWQWGTLLSDTSQALRFLALSTLPVSSSKTLSAGKTQVFCLHLTT